MILAYYRNPSLAEGPQRPTQTPAVLPQEPPEALALATPAETDATAADGAPEQPPPPPAQRPPRHR